jgi:hypothetical protein
VLNIHLWHLNVRRLVLKGLWRLFCMLIVHWHIHVFSLSLTCFENKYSMTGILTQNKKWQSEYLRDLLIKQDIIQFAFFIKKNILECVDIILTILKFNECFTQRVWRSCVLTLILTSSLLPSDFFHWYLDLSKLLKQKGTLLLLWTLCRMHWLNEVCTQHIRYLL